MTKYIRIAVDTSKAVFTVHGIDEQNRPVLRGNYSREKFEAFLRKTEATEVVLEACGSSHHWGRVLASIGHTVKLIPPQYVKPYVKRGKNDRNDAEAICEAASRPGMRFVPVKTAEAQAQAMDLKLRDLLVRQRTQLINALRGHAAEFGIIAAKGISNVEALLKKIAETDSPVAAKTTLAQLGQAIDTLDAQLAEIEKRLNARHKSNELSQRLATMPGIGPIIALALSLGVDFSQFESGRHFSAWLGLTPRDKSTGGRQRFGSISRAGNERLRQLLIVGATAVIRHAKPEGKNPNPWSLLQNSCFRLVGEI
jgi:transposase